MKRLFVRFSQRWRAALVAGACIALPSILNHSLSLEAAAAAQSGRIEQVLPRPQIIVLDPLVQFEDLGGGSKASRGASEASAFASRLLAAAKRELEAERLELVPPESCRDLLEVDDCVRLQRLSSRLSRGSVPQEAGDILKRLGAASDGAAVLVQFMRVKVGPGRSWNPNSGAITSSIASTLLQAALVASNTGKVVWSAEVFVRKTFRPDSSELEKHFALLYQTFVAK